MSVNPQKSIYQFLDTNGDGSGTKNANGNYATVPQDFYFEADGLCELHRIIFHISDTSTVQAQEYGNLGAALSNGYLLECKDENDNVILDLTDGIEIKTNGDIGRYCYDVEVKSWGAGDEFVQARWTFAKSGSPLLLSTGHKLVITLNDNLSGLLEHYFMIHGMKL